MSSTRLLLLGALRQIQPAHGYHIKQELEAWEADKWTPIAYGSVYHALNTMHAEGLLGVTLSDSAKGGSKKIYTVTQKGEDEYNKMLEDAWRSPQTAYNPFQVALVFSNDVSNESYRAGLETRIKAAQTLLEHLEIRKKNSTQHTIANIDLVIGQQQAFLDWAAKYKNKP